MCLLYMPIRPNDMIVGNFYTFEYEPFQFPSTFIPRNTPRETKNMLGQYLGTTNIAGKTFCNFNIAPLPSLDLIRSGDNNISMNMLSRDRIRSGDNNIIELDSTRLRDINLLNKLYRQPSKTALGRMMRGESDVAEDITPRLGPNALYPKYRYDDVAGQTGGKKKSRRRNKKSKRSRKRTNKRLK